MIEEIQLPKCGRGLGDLILQPESPKLIEGVLAQPQPVYPDDRGYFVEVGRLTRDLLSDFPADSSQISASMSYPGTVKAFHFHRRQTDYWVPVAGMLQVALVDLRPSSPSFGVRNTMYLGTLRPWRLLVPPGVGHGYKVVSPEPAILVYVTNRFYDPEDEGRIPYNSPEINYDWETQHK